MKFAKWGNSLAVRIPADVVEKLGLEPGQKAEFEVTGEGRLSIRRGLTSQEALACLRALRQPLPSGYKFQRDELYQRGVREEERERRAS
jgi:antitoxin MazE